MDRPDNRLFGYPTPLYILVRAVAVMVKAAIIIQ